MREFSSLVVPFMAGVGLGAVFFGGLWWTVTRAVSSRWPALWLIASKILRMGVVLAGFYWVGHNDWERLAACLVGFVSARTGVMKMTGTTAKRRRPLAKEARHAP